MAEHVDYQKFVLTLSWCRLLTTNPFTPSDSVRCLLATVYRVGSIHVVQQCLHKLYWPLWLGTRSGGMHNPRTLRSSSVDCVIIMYMLMNAFGLHAHPHLDHCSYIV